MLCLAGLSHLSCTAHVCELTDANSPFTSVHGCREEKEEKDCWCVEPRRASYKMSYDLITSQPIVIDNVRRYTMVLL